jgi:glycolate oxidase iron-sulfur subunit
MDTHIDLEKPAQTEYSNCIRCGLCNSVCPTYLESLNEINSPRGRLELARKGLIGQLELTPNLIEQMYACFFCKACDDICPVGLKPAGLALSMRRIQEQIKPIGWKQVLFSGLVSHPGRLETATLPLRLYERSGLRRLSHALQLPNLLPSQFRDMESMLPHLPQRPFRQTFPEIIPAYGQTRYKVGFFLGCAQNLFFPDQSAATIRVLARNGCTVTIPKDVQCCGMPALGFGRHDLVRLQAKHNIELFEKNNTDIILTDCATCGSTLKDYGTLLKDDIEWVERANVFSSRVQDVSEFLAGIPLEKPKGRLETRVTYHDPCHLCYAQNVKDEPRLLLAMINGLDFVELPEAGCCGSAGSQLITHYETSRKVMDRKTDNLASTKAQVVASGCPACQMQLNTAISRRGLKMRVVHPITLLDEAYEAENGQANN